MASSCSGTYVDPTDQSRCAADLHRWYLAAVDTHDRCPRYRQLLIVYLSPNFPFSPPFPIHPSPPFPSSSSPCCKLPQWGLGEAPADIDFGVF